jgi:tryptophan 6-halogenase
MRNIKVSDIVIVGGGSSGWLSAIYLLKRFKDLNVTLIESAKISTIGVGESIQPSVTSFLLDIGYKSTDWMPHANATYKLGTMFKGWSDNQFLVDSESIAFSSLDTTDYDYFGTHDAAIATGMTAKEWSDWFPPHRMAVNNKSPKFGKERLNYLDGNLQVGINAVQWDNVSTIEWLKSECIKLGVNHIVDNVVNIELDQEGYIRELILEDRVVSVSGDLYIDCSGFSGVLIDGVCKRPWESVEHILPTNNAIAIRKKYTNPQKECHPYTGATAMDSGWMWTIPTYNDLTHGYVYSDKYIDKDDAEHELRTKINEWDAPAKHVPFRAGQRDRIAHKNVYAVGLSAGFLEPLEATNLTFTVNAITNLSVLLVEHGGMYNDETMAPFISKMFSMQFDELLNFIYMHYKMSTKNDTLFWKEIKEKSIPDQVLPMHNAVIDGPLSQLEFHNIVMKDRPRFRTLPSEPMFHAGHWWQLLKGCGKYEHLNSERTYSDNFTKYSKLMMNIHSSRIDGVLDIFPNHYDYLREWYE